jgi:hypothetical protein
MQAVRVYEAIHSAGRRESKRGKEGEARRGREEGGGRHRHRGEDC